MDDLKKKLESLGLLHDSVVRQLIWIPDENTIEFIVEDFFSNFEGQPEYPGLVGGSVILRDVQQVRLDIEYREKHLFIYEFVAEEISAGNHRITVTFRPSGRIEAICRFVQFPELNIFSHRI